MATIYKRTDTRPIPQGAELADCRGRRYAKWTDAKTGKARRAPLNKAGDKIVCESPYYTIQYFDHAGKRRKVSTRCSDKDAVQRMANDLETKAMQRREGLIDATAERISQEGKRPLREHVDMFRATMEAANRTAKHIRETINYIEQVAAAAGFETIGDINADAVNTYAADMRANGQSARSIQAVLTAVKSFTRWLAKHGKLSAEPLASVKKPDPKADRRYERRMLLHDEWNWLRTVTDNGPERYGISGHERNLLYATAIQTGLRSGELRSLSRGKMFLDDERPYIVCKAGSTKNRKQARQYIKSDLADLLKAHIATKSPKAPVFTMPHESNVAEMIRDDLAAARKAWVNTVKHDPAERLRREQSDFLAKENHDSEQFDFHSLRHTCGAWLAMAGVHPKVVQAVMRHSSITLTMDTYGHLFPGQEADAVAKLPGMMADEPQALAATGTDDAISERGHQRGQLKGESCQTVADAGETECDGADAGENTKLLPLNGLGDDRQSLASSGESAPSWTRTKNLLIKSQLLCQLS